MSLAQLLRVVIARRRSALGVLAALVALVTIYTLLQPRQYLATAAVMVDSRSVDPVAAPGANGATNTSGYMATQIDLIQSERVARRAAHAMKLDADADWHARWMDSTSGRGVYEAWLAEQLLKKLEVKPSRESSVINIGYLASDPVFAAAVANAFVNAYVDTTLDMKVEPAKQYTAFFDERSKALRASLEQAQARLSTYQQAHGIIATDEKLDVENARLAELSSQVVVLQSAAAESASRRGQSGSDSQEVLSNITIGTMTADLSRQEARLNELKERLGAANPQILELSANIAEQRTRLAAETRRVSASLGVNTNVDQARLNAAQSALEAQRARVLAMSGQRDEASVLLRDVSNAQKAYDASLARATQTSLESQNTQTNVSIIKSASPPPFASSPRLLLNLAVALVIGSLLGIGFALARELTDRRLRFESDVTDGLRQLMLVSIPGRTSEETDASSVSRLRKLRIINITPRALS